MAKFLLNSESKPLVSQVEETSNKPVSNNVKMKVDVPMPCAGLPRMANYIAGNGDGCSCYRITWPSQILNDMEKAVCDCFRIYVPVPDFYRNINVVRVQRQVAPEQYEFLKFLKSVKSKYNFKLMYEIDDIPFREDIPDYNPGKKPFDNDIIRKSAEDCMRICDYITVNSQFAQEYYRNKLQQDNILWYPNYLPKFAFDRFYDPDRLYKNYEINLNRPKILYAGSGAHLDLRNETNQKDDFEKICDFIIKTRKKYQWIFMGCLPLKLKAFVNSGDIVYHNWQSLLSYPYKINEILPNVVLAPLQDNTFNRSKSDQKFTEFASFGIPGIYQNLNPYKDSFLKFDNVDELENNISLLFSDFTYYKEISEKSRKYIDDHRWLENNYEKIFDIFFK